jgi:hypothetical protein
MGVSIQVLIYVWGGVSAITTTIFLGALYLGRYIGRFETMEQKVEDHDRRLRVFESAGV